MLHTTLLFSSFAPQVGHDDAPMGVLFLCAGLLYIFVCVLCSRRHILMVMVLGVRGTVRIEKADILCTWATSQKWTSPCTLQTMIFGPAIFKNQKKEGPYVVSHKKKV